MDNNTPLLNDEKKNFLENYDKENPFLKSLSNQYKERGTLSEKQIIHLRKETQQDKKIHTRCEVLHLSLNQECVFEDKSYNENKNVFVSKISEKAIQIEDKENNMYAWMPKAGVQVNTKLDDSEGGNNTPVLIKEVSILTLKSWFTRDEDFWKQKKPSPELIVEEQANSLVEEQANALMDLDIQDEDFTDEMTSYEEDDKLPF